MSARLIQVGHKHAQVAAAHPAVLDQVGEHISRDVRCNGEADANIALAKRSSSQNHCVDSDDLAFKIHKRSAGVPGVDGSIGLYESAKHPVITAIAKLAPRCTHDAGGQRLLKTKWTTQCEHPIALLDFVGIPCKHCDRQTDGVDLDDRQIGSRVLSDYCRL